MQMCVIFLTHQEESVSPRYSRICNLTEKYVWLTGAIFSDKMSLRPPAALSCQ